jgi:hypothetical protein
LRAATLAGEGSDIENNLTEARKKLRNYLFVCGVFMPRLEFEQRHPEFEGLKAFRAPPKAAS